MSHLRPQRATAAPRHHFLAEMVQYQLQEGRIRGCSLNDKIKIYDTLENILKYITFEVTVFLTIFLRSRSKGILSFNAQGACLSGGASHPLGGPPCPGEPSSHRLPGCALPGAGAPHSHQAWGRTACPSAPRQLSSWPVRNFKYNLTEHDSKP